MSREVICKDALKWLSTLDKVECIVTSLPDLDELTSLSKSSYTTAEYKKQFTDFAEAVFKVITDKGYVIFYQTDRKKQGIIDKSFLLSKVADELGFNMMWHKICLKRDIGKVNLFRPTYSHVLCYSKKGKPGKAFPDVFYCGKMIYENAMGLEALEYVMEWIKHQDITTIIDPFCGQGSIIAMANYYNLNSIGIDIDKSQCEKARKLTINKADLRK